MAAGSPMGSSRMSTMLGSRPTTSGGNFNLMQVDVVAAGDLARVHSVIGHCLETMVLSSET